MSQMDYFCGQVSGETKLRGDLRELRSSRLLRYLRQRVVAGKKKGIQLPPKGVSDGPIQACPRVRSSRRGSHRTVLPSGRRLPAAQPRRRTVRNSQEAFG